MDNDKAQTNNSFVLDTDNSFFRLAADYVNHTRQSIFLTGKAGTGKTTFLKYIKETTHKQAVVAAPTGIAAINAGGVTVHSLFQLPFEPFIPTAEGKRKYHANKFKMSKRKLDLLRSMELLIIDEVSMLRSDLLDAIDSSLCRVRRNNLPFGGVQMLYIGDPFQLPPVVKEQEWDLLQNYYRSPFFFHSKAFEQNPPTFIELKKIYRQKDQHFVDLLNRARNNVLTAADIETLNALYNPAFVAPQDEKYIILTTHNYKATAINQEHLDELTSEQHSYAGTITGDFPLQMLPTEQTLQLKEGAQIMFIKNDIGENRRYYNGRLATVIALKSKTIKVRLVDSDLEFDISHDTWENIRYTQNPSSGLIEEEVLGSFSQYPIRLAWAITIHKSQGLTFERAVIDAGKAFAPGQVYVALSRCTTLDGIVLHSHIDPASVFTDPEVFSYTDKELPLEQLQSCLETEKKQYCRETLINTFDLDILLRFFVEFKRFLPAEQELCFDDARQCIGKIEKRALEEYEIAAKFRAQLQRLIVDVENGGDIALLKERTEKAVNYFCTFIEKEILLPLKEHAATFKKDKKLASYLKTLTGLEQDILFYLKRMRNANYAGIPLVEQKKEQVPELPEKEEKKTRKSKTQSALESLELFKKGMSVGDIAEARDYSPRTIEDHLAECIKNGDLPVLDMLDEEALKIITAAINSEESHDYKLTPIKEKLSEDYSYFDIKMVVAHLIFESTKG